MDLLLYIHWNPDPTFFHLFGFPILYYSLLWVVGIACSYLIAKRGHCLFYQPEYYLSGVKPFFEMILPIKFLPDGGWEWIGYKGLASHGGTLGLAIALWFYCRKTRMHFMDVLDIIAVATPICACCIRLANLMNSEIIGNPTSVPWAFVFERVDTLPRHPGQLYEAIAYFIFFLGMMYLYRRGIRLRRTEIIGMDKKSVAALPAAWPHRRGFYFGLCLTEIFTFRFFIEFLKADQVAFEQSMTLNMGQWLSIPFILVGVYCMFFYEKKK